MAESEPKTPQTSGLLHRLGEAKGLLTYSALRFYNDNCFQTAAALTYTTLLAIVPLMTIGFAIFSAFPAFSDLRTQVQTLIFKNMVPEIGDALLEYLGAFMANAGQMPTFGIIGLAVSAVLLIWTIEGSFATVWRVREPRSLVMRILSFWAVVTLAPLFVGVSLSLSSTLWSVLQFVHLDGVANPLAGMTVILPLVIQLVGCTLLYVIIPNRQVNWLDAICGGAVAALLLEVSKAGFAWYMREYPAYQTIYGALSTVPIFLFWLYIAWSTVLFGAVLTASLPEWRAGKVTRGGLQGLLSGQRLALALAVLEGLLDASRLGVGMRRRTLTRRLPVGTVLVEAILEQLRDAHWVAQTTRDSWVVTRDLSEVTLCDLIKALGIGMRGSVRGLGGMELPWQDRIADLLEQADDAQSDILNVSVKDLLTNPDVVDVGVGDAGLNDGCDNDQPRISDQTGDDMSAITPVDSRRLGETVRSTQP